MQRIQIVCFHAETTECTGFAVMLLNSDKTFTVASYVYLTRKLWLIICFWKLKSSPLCSIKIETCENCFRSRMFLDNVSRMFLEHVCHIPHYKCIRRTMEATARTLLNKLVSSIFLAYNYS